MEQVVGNVLGGLGMALHPVALFYVFLGTAIGMIAGALPGVTATATMAVLLPVTYGMVPEYAVMFLVSILVGSGFGDSIPAILIKTPGTPTAVLTTIEGYPFHLRGESGRALGLVLFSGLVGQAVGILVFIAFVVPLSQWAVKLLAPEIFALAVFGLTAAAGLTGRNVAKGVVAALFGLALATVGSDPLTGLPRFDFGNVDLQYGFGIVPVTVGLLVVSEVLVGARQMIRWERVIGHFSARMPSWEDIRFCAPAIAVGAIIGIIVGIMPGAGATVASFITYQQVRHIAKEPHMWGRGSREALASLDAANSSCFGGDLITTLGLGIPGSIAMAIILVALMLHGVQPGPLLMQDRPALMYAVFGGLLVGLVAVRVLGYLAIRPSIYLATMSRPVVLVGILVLSAVGVYALNWRLFDIYVMTWFGIVGYFMRRYGYSVGPAVLGLVLGDLVEAELRRGLVMSHGSLLALVGRPLTAALLLLSLASLLYPVVLGYLRKRGAASVPFQKRGEEL